MILANVRKDVPPKVVHVGEKKQPCSSWCHAGRSFCNTFAIANCPPHNVINVLDEQPNKKFPLVFGAAVLEYPDGWLDDVHFIAAPQYLLQEQHPYMAKYITAVHQNI